MDENQVGDRHPVVGEYGTALRSAPNAGPARRLRSPSISASYLEAKSCKANALIDFLRSHYAEILYLAGDMVDGWNSGRYWCWGPAQNAAAREIVNWGWRSARIRLLSGNHNRRMRLRFGWRFLRIYLKRFLSKASLTATRLNEARL